MPPGFVGWVVPTHRTSARILQPTTKTTIILGTLQCLSRCGLLPSDRWETNSTGDLGARRSKPAKVSSCAERAAAVEQRRTQHPSRLATALHYLSQLALLAKTSRPAQRGTRPLRPAKPKSHARNPDPRPSSTQAGPCATAAYPADCPERAFEVVIRYRYHRQLTRQGRHEISTNWTQSRAVQVGLRAASDFCLHARLRPAGRTHL